MTLETIIDSLIESIELMDDKAESEFLYVLSDATEVRVESEVA